MMRWVVTGAGGMLGHAVVEAALGQGDSVVGLTHLECDITDARSVDATLGRGIDVVINTAAWTDVDGAEASESAAYAVNATGPHNLATACARIGAVLVQISTDYVFDGNASVPYPEDEPTAPVSAYGRTKAAGERYVLDALPATAYVVRTAWLYGPGGRNFVSTMRELESTREVVHVVDDQFGQPTYTIDLAEQVLAIGRRARAAALPAGVLHVTNSGVASWYEFAREIFAESGADPDRVRPIPSQDLHRPAPRPRWSVLGHDAADRAQLPPMRPWRAALHHAIGSAAV